MALANVASGSGSKELRVVMIDWDLEARDWELLRGRRLGKGCARSKLGCST
jgi:hypothetical protein